MADSDNELEQLEEELRKHVSHFNEPPSAAVSASVRAQADAHVRQSLRVGVSPTARSFAEQKTAARRAPRVPPHQMQNDFVRFLQNRTGVRKQPLWQLGASLAAGVLIGFFGAQWIGAPAYQTRSDKPPSSQHAWMGGGVSEGVQKLEEAPPEEWQRVIAELVMAGDIDQALLAIERFRTTFPDWQSGQPTLHQTPGSQSPPGAP